MEERLFMDAVITPHRSMSAKGFIILISVLTGINAVSAAFFVMLGAGPIPIFLGLDVLAVIVAFGVSRRSGRRHERVRVTVSQVRVDVVSPRGEETVWVSPTAFTRLALVGDPGDAGYVRLRLSGRERPIAGDLSRPERQAFAEALDSALWRARSDRHQAAE